MTSRFSENGLPQWLRFVTTLLVINSVFAGDRVLPGKSGSPGVLQPLHAATLPLEPVYRFKFVESRQRYATHSQVEAYRLESRLEGVAFRAVATREWPAGLVPVFAIEQTNRFELHRRPVPGEENFSEPLFFALPPEGESDVFKITGGWECRATRGDASKLYLGWELAAEADQVSGRFDQNTDYRFAQILGGTFRSNRFELRVKYIADNYSLSGEWREGRLKGEWHSADKFERGVWEASRAESRIPASKDTVHLYEWRRVSDDACRYAVDGEQMEPGWERSPRPLCRVWSPRVTGEN